MYVQRQSIRNFRCFEDVDVEFLAPGGTLLDNVNLILGNNGSGKSTLLRALALTALSGVIDQSGFVPRHLVRRGGVAQAELEGTLQLEHQDAASISPGTTEAHRARTAIQRRGHFERIIPESQADAFEGLFYEDSPSFLVLGYGATRRVDMSETFDPQAQKRLRLVRYQRVAGLFEDHIALVPLHSWFANVEARRRAEIIDLMNELLPEELRFQGEWEERELVFRQEGRLVPFAALSDGFRGFIGLVSDILYHLYDVAGEEALTSLSGLVLIDEIDLHLHPSWQRTVAPTFSRVFPRLQFILTSHSPIVVGTLYHHNVIVLDFDVSDDSEAEVWPKAIAKRLGERAHGLNADQILVSSYFGLQTTRAPDAERQRRKLELDAALGDKQAAREYLRSLVSGSDDEANRGESPR